MFPDKLRVSSFPDRFPYRQSQPIPTTLGQVSASTQLSSLANGSHRGRPGLERCTLSSLLADNAVLCLDVFRTTLCFVFTSCGQRCTARLADNAVLCLDVLRTTLYCTSCGQRCALSSRLSDNAVLCLHVLRTTLYCTSCGQRCA